MIRILGDIPNENLGLALSGGIDSMTIATFLLKGRYDFTAFHFNHGTAHGKEAEQFVTDWCDENKVTLAKSHINDVEDMFDIKEWKGSQDWFRNHRYSFFQRFKDFEIITCHHLDDVLESWLFSTFHGKAKLIPYRNNNCIRPFLRTTKDDISKFALKHSVPWIEDKSNASTDYMRNRIRHNIVPEVEQINPGIRKHIDNLVVHMYDKHLNKTGE